ncbi:MAG: Na/Pi cotransporter family protein [Cyclobacteriaceae bacterium]
MNSFGVYNFLEILGGLGIFIYGMKLMSEGIQKVAGSQLRRIMTYMTKTRLGGVFSGFGLTAVIQSSSATTVMIVSFVNAGLMTLRQSIGVIMGANIGTTITGWLLILPLLSFKVSISSLALPIIGVSAPLLFSGIKKWKSFGEFAIGFGLLFMGLNFMKNAIPDLSNNQEVLSFLAEVSSSGFLNTILFVFIGVLLTVIVQSSSVALTINLVLLAQGLLPIESSIAMLLGENIGTTITAGLASLVGNISAKRSACVHLIFNLFGVALVLLLLPLFIHLIEGIMAQMVDVESPLYYSSVLVMFHTAFNFWNTCLWFGLVPFLEKMVVKLVPDRDKDSFRTDLILGKNIIDTSEMATVEAMQEIKKLSKTIQTIYRDALQVMKGKDFSELLINDLDLTEQNIENTRKSTANFLMEVSRTNISEETSNKVMNMLIMLKDLDLLADESINLIQHLRNIKESDAHFIPKLNTNLVKTGDLIEEYLKDTLYLMRRGKRKKVDLKSDQLQYTINDQVDNLKVRLNKKKSIANMSLQESILFRELLGGLEKFADHMYSFHEGVLEIA